MNALAELKGGKGNKLWKRTHCLLSLFKVNNKYYSTKDTQLTIISTFGVCSGEQRKLPTVSPGWASDKVWSVASSLVLTVGYSYGSKGETLRVRSQGTML